MFADRKHYDILSAVWELKGGHKEIEEILQWKMSTFFSPSVMTFFFCEQVPLLWCCLDYRAGVAKHFYLRRRLLLQELSCQQGSAWVLSCFSNVSHFIWPCYSSQVTGGRQCSAKGICGCSPGTSISSGGGGEEKKFVKRPIPNLRILSLAHGPGMRVAQGYIYMSSSTI